MEHVVAENIRLELNKPRVKSSISVRQGDTATRAIHATLTNNGSVYELKGALVATITIDKPDGTQCYNNCVISGNEIQYTITSQSINVIGECLCQFQVTFEDGATVESPEFSMIVYTKNVNESAVMSQNEYSALTEQIVMACEYANNASASAMESATSAENAATSETNANEYMTAAATSAESAATSETNAATSETNANEYMANAVAAKQAMDSRATAAELYIESKATEAATSALNAATSETNANEYMIAAATSAENAAISETNAASSESKATEAADKAEQLYADFKASGQLVLGEEHDEAFYGDMGKAAYDHAMVANGNPHGTTYADVGADKEGLASECYQNAVAYTDKAIADLINGAPGTLDTLKEIADAMAENEDVVAALDSAIGTKANQSQLDTHEANETIHIEASEREKWDGYEAAIQENATAIEECLKSVSDGKTTVAEAITALGVATAADADFDTMAANITSAGTVKYNAGVTYADGRANTASTNYKTGYNAGYSAGVTAADNRANANSTNYKTGYNAGYSAGVSAGRSLSSQTVTIPFSIGANTETQVNGAASFASRIVGVTYLHTDEYYPVALNMSVSGNAIAVHICNWTSGTISGNIEVTVVGY